jgi:hypothetical protein
MLPAPDRTTVILYVGDDARTLWEAPTPDLLVCIPDAENQPCHARPADPVLVAWPTELGSQTPGRPGSTVQVDSWCRLVEPWVDG